LVFVITGTDPDGDVLTYTFVNHSEQIFELNPVTGEIVTLDSAALNYEELFPDTTFTLIISSLTEAACSL